MHGQHLVLHFFPENERTSDLANRYFTNTHFKVGYQLLCNNGSYNVGIFKTGPPLEDYNAERVVHAWWNGGQRERRPQFDDNANGQLDEEQLLDFMMNVKVGRTSLHLAAEDGHLQVTKCLVEQAGVSPPVKTHAARYFIEVHKNARTRSKDCSHKRGIECSLYRKQQFVRLCEVAIELQLEVTETQDDYKDMDSFRRTVDVNVAKYFLPEITTILNWNSDLRDLPLIES
ncbi:unnamed protein product [Mytilus coruscus]|uniref:Uncharacterized protein n=1 Tax=Mytilus coruscus TaxID=42192 RepID=A0A6J8A4T0_MYTCO|nr:unnamed protein product [Mytilus coruscus]